MTKMFFRFCVILCVLFYPIEIYSQYNVAFYKTAMASSIENSDPIYVAGYAIDGDVTTRWSS